MTTTSETAARLRYCEDHWARQPASEALVDRFLAGYRYVYPRTKVALFDRLLGERLDGRRVLDYGGGAGYMAALCAGKGARVTLVDAEANALETARLLARRQGVLHAVETICAETFPEELRGRQFDIVILKDVIEHIPRDEGLLADLASCQAPGGQLLLSTQNSFSCNYLLEGTYQRWWRGETGWCGWDPTHVRFYTPALLSRRLRAAGYRPRRWAGLYIVPYNILSWPLLLKREIVIQSLHKVDLSIGHVFPFNRLGWNVVVAAERDANGSARSSKETL